MHRLSTVNDAWMIDSSGFFPHCCYWKKLTYTDLFDRAREKEIGNDYEKRKKIEIIVFNGDIRIERIFHHVYENVCENLMHWMMEEWQIDVIDGQLRNHWMLYEFENDRQDSVLDWFVERDQRISSTENSR